jgi:hypothetical protein
MPKHESAQEVASTGALPPLRVDSGADESFEILNWSLWKNRCVPTGRLDVPSCRSMIALRFITSQDIFWGMT